MLLFFPSIWVFSLVARLSKTDDAAEIVPEDILVGVPGWYPEVLENIRTESTTNQATILESYLNVFVQKN